MSLLAMNLTVAAIEKWWSANKDNRNCWQTPIGSGIKLVVTEAGNWKNAPRGNPRAGGRAAQINKKRATTVGDGL
jgi:hypothetical protein